MSFIIPVPRISIILYSLLSINNGVTEKAGTLNSKAIPFSEELSILISSAKREEMITRKRMQEIILFILTSLHIV
ncbi:hypothetical protein ES703_07621 [subsurface metagenome]